MKLLGCLFLLLVIFVIYFAINILITKLIIWLSAGLFNYPLDDKFWYVFVTIALIQMFLGGIKVNYGGK